MLEPSKTAPDYDEQMKKFKEDNSSWGQDSSKIDIMKSPLVTGEPGKPATAPNTNNQNNGRR